MKGVSHLSPAVVNHIQSLLQPIAEASPGASCMMVYPRNNLTSKETALFWRYHGLFPQEFVKAVESMLPENYKFVEYNHLRNQLTCEVE